MLIVGVAFSGFGGWLAWRSIKAQAAHDWPTVTGTVVGHETERYKSRRSSPRYEPRVEYEYRVDGAYFRSSRYQFTGSTGLPRSMSQAEALEGAKIRWPKGSDIQVFYNPEAPEECTLKHSDPEWLFSGVAGGVGVVMVGIVAVQVVSERRRARRG